METGQSGINGVTVPQLVALKVSYLDQGVVIPRQLSMEGWIALGQMKNRQAVLIQFPVQVKYTGR